MTRVIIAFFVALSLWAKELTPLLMLFGILFYRLFSREYKKFFLELCFVGLLGVLIFWISWCLFCRAIDIDVLGFIRFTIIGKGSKAFNSSFFLGMFKQIFALFRWPVYWVSTPFWIGILFSLSRRLKSYVKGVNLNKLDVIFFVGLCVWLPYLIFKPNPGMMKYQYPAYPFFIIILSVLFGEASKRIDFRKISIWRYISGFLVFLALIYSYYGLGDYILSLWSPIYKHLNGKFLWLYYSPLVMLYLAVFILSKRQKLDFLIISVILSIFPINLGLLINQARADYTPIEISRNYGERGQLKSINYLSDNRVEGKAFFARRDVIYALEYNKDLGFRDGVDIGKLLGVSTLRQAMIILRQMNPEYIVLDSFSFKVGHNPDILKFLLETYNRDKIFGDFCILKRKSR